MRFDGKYGEYASDLACSTHVGPKQKNNSYL